MNKQTFTSLLNALDESQWQAIVNGNALLMVNDLRLEVGNPNSFNVIVPPSLGLDASTLRIESLAQSEALIYNYYRTHPLSRKAFTDQSTFLVAQYGGVAFAAKECTLPERTLFVEGGEVLAENRESPRHRYGAFCELESDALDHPEILAQVETWLKSGAAHERYLEMNVCRYTC